MTGPRLPSVVNDSVGHTSNITLLAFWKNIVFIYMGCLWSLERKVLMSAQIISRELAERGLYGRNEGWELCDSQLKKTGCQWWTAILGVRCWHHCQRRLVVPCPIGMKKWTNKTQAYYVSTGLKWCYHIRTRKGIKSANVHTARGHLMRKMLNIGLAWALAKGWAQSRPASRWKVEVHVRGRVNRGSNRGGFSETRPCECRWCRTSLTRLPRLPPKARHQEI